MNQKDNNSEGSSKAGQGLSGGDTASEYSAPDNALSVEQEQVDVADNAVSMEGEAVQDTDTQQSLHSKTRTPSCLPQILVASILILLIMAAAGYYLWQQGRIQRMELERYMRDMQETAQQQWQQRLQEKESQITELQQQQQELQGTVSRVHELASRNSQDWVLAEVEYLLLIANHRLQLEQDVETAMTALRLADERLRDLANPALSRVRGEIARELEALRTLAMPDYNGLALRLDAMSQKVLRLGTRAAHPQVEGGQSAPGEEGSSEVTSGGAPKAVDKKIDWREISEGLWNELRTLVVIRKHDQNIMPMLTAEQEHSLRQGLRMKLETSRARVLQKDEEDFVLEMQGARQWLEEYFDAEDPGVEEMKVSMDELMQARLRVEMPDISASLSSLRAERK